MIQHKHVTAAIATMLVLALLAGAAAAPVVAKHNDDDSLSDAFAADDDDRLGTIIGFASGLTDRIGYQARNLVNDAPAAEENRDDAIEAFNSNSESLINWSNDRGVSSNQATEVAEVTFAQNGEDATMYVVWEYNETAGEYISAEAVSETDRDVDYEIRLEAMAAENAAEEIEYFANEFAEPNENVTSAYISEMATKYASDVDEPFTES